MQSSDHHCSHCISLVCSPARQPFGLNGLAALGSTQTSPLCDVAIWVWWATKPYLVEQKCDYQHEVLWYMCEPRSSSNWLACTATTQRCSPVFAIYDHSVSQTCQPCRYSYTCMHDFWYVLNVKQGGISGTHTRSISSAAMHLDEPVMRPPTLFTRLRVVPLRSHHIVLRLKNTTRRPGPY